MLTILNDQNGSEILGDERTVVIKFGADWCAPRKAFAPIFEALSNERTDLLFADCNIDEASYLASVYGIRKVPTVILANGIGTMEYKGNLLPSEFRKWVETYA